MSPDHADREIRRLRHRVEELEEELRQVRANLRPSSIPAPRWRLTPGEWRILWLLYTCPGPVNRDRLGSLLYEGAEADRTLQSVPVMMVRLRRKLAAMGVGIVIETHRGFGWEMPGVSRANMQEALGLDADPVPGEVPPGSIHYRSGKSYEQLREEARALRRLGMVVGDIATRLDISLTSAQKYVCDLPEHAAATRANRTAGRRLYAARAYEARP